jgi:hypothetical protein
VNCSQVPIVVRFAISGDAPALSAVTIMLLAMARRLSTMPVLPAVIPDSAPEHERYAAGSAADATLAELCQRRHDDQALPETRR